LQILGRIIHLNSNGNVIVKARNVPRMGDTVVDGDLKKIGRVFDIFGPVKSPYVTVKSAKHNHKLKNKKLFILHKKNKRGKTAYGI